MTHREQKKEEVLAAVLRLVQGNVRRGDLREGLQRAVVDLESVGVGQVEARRLLGSLFRVWRWSQSKDFHLRLRQVTKGATVKGLTREERQKRREQQKKSGRRDNCSRRSATTDFAV